MGTLGKERVIEHSFIFEIGTRGSKDDSWFIP